MLARAISAASTAETSDNTTVKVEYERYYSDGAIWLGLPTRRDLMFTAGRWVIDCAHDTYKTELHPIFMFSRMRTVTTLHRSVHRDRGSESVRRNAGESGSRDASRHLGQRLVSRRSHRVRHLPAAPAHIQTRHWSSTSRRCAGGLRHQLRLSRANADGPEHARPSSLHRAVCVRTR